MAILGEESSILACISYVPDTLWRPTQCTQALGDQKGVLRFFLSTLLFEISAKDYFFTIFAVSKMLDTSKYLFFFGGSVVYMVYLKG